MGTSEIDWRGLLRAVVACFGAAVLASCANAPVAPAPVEMRGAVLGIGDMGEPAPQRAAPGQRAAGYVIVRPGQSLRGIAHSYRVPEREIIAANHLKPPYKLAAGMRLLIPGGAAPPGAATEHAATVPPAAMNRPPAERDPAIIPLDGPAPPKTSAAPPAPPPASPAAASVAAEVARESERSAPTLAPPRAAGPSERAAAAEAGAPPPAVHGGRFPWPVPGRVLTGYGAGAGGAHNDGINIAAARGTPIRAIEGGVVAYAGNELRGYGNLVLVKHPDGWISAYAHCDELLVKKGEKIGPGQVIGRVGASGGVAEPQLHFELRRGKQPVDPRQFLAPGPSAGAEEAPRRGWNFVSSRLLRFARNDSKGCHCEERSDEAISASRVPG